MKALSITSEPEPLLPRPYFDEGGGRAEMMTLSAVVFKAFKINSSLSSEKIFPNPQYEAGDKNQSCFDGGDGVPQSTF